MVTDFAVITFSSGLCQTTALYNSVDECVVVVRYVLSSPPMVTDFAVIYSSNYDGDYPILELTLMGPLSEDKSGNSSNQDLYVNVTPAAAGNYSDQVMRAAPIRVPVPVMDRVRLNREFPVFYSLRSVYTENKFGNRSDCYLV